MTNYIASKSKALPGIFFAVLFAILGFTSCGGGGAAAPANITPTVTIFVSSTSIPYNSNIDISWSSTNSTACTSPGGGGTNATGTFNTGQLTTTTTYTVTCGTASQSVTIAAGSPDFAAAITGFADAGGGNVTVTAANNLANGNTITIYGTTNYNGTYTVANRAAVSFTIVATFVARDATGVWQKASGMLSGCSTNTTSGSPGTITLSNIPSRFTGVAPLSVFFDASATSATATTRPFHDLEYRWNFGDTSSGNWGDKNTGSSGTGENTNRNVAYGPVAAHVFETPGLYTVALTATDGTNTVTNSCAQIAVQYPDSVFVGTKTACFSTSGNFTGCPAGAINITTSNFVTAVSGYQGTTKRLLFRRGEAFAAATTARIDSTGPGTVGAFGTGALPIIRMTGNTVILKLSQPSTPTFNDWRIMDLELDGMSGAASEGVVSDGGADKITFLRVYAHDIHHGIHFTDSILDHYNHGGASGHHMFDQLAIVDSTFLRIVGGAGGRGFTAAAKHFAALGNIVDDTTKSGHVVRFYYLNKAVISNNQFSRQAPSTGVIKMHGPTWCTAGSPLDGNGNCTAKSPGYTSGTIPLGVAGVDGGYTQQIITSDNKLVSGDGTDISVGFGPQNAQSDERLRNIIIERNWFVAGNTTQQTLHVRAVDVTVRNNICNITSTTYHMCIHVGVNGLEPPPNNVHIYNNTIYSASTGDFVGINIQELSTNTVVYNNLGSAPFANTTKRLVADLGTGTIQGNNLLNSSPAELFISATPSLPADFLLKSPPNPARDTGASGVLAVPVFSDFFLTNRPQSGVPGVIDMGAIEGP